MAEGPAGNEQADPPSLGLPGATVSAYAVAGDDSPFERRARTVVPPASNTKLVTTALALDTLGSSHRFETTVDVAGHVEGRVLRGDVVLAGNGNPDLTPSDLDELAGAIGDRIDRIEGDIVVDTRPFEGARLGPGRTWGDARHAYGAPTAATSLSGNTASITVTTDEFDELVVGCTPRSGAIQTTFDVTVDPNAEQPDVSARLTPDDGTIHVEGEIPLDGEGETSAPVPEPNRHCGLVFREALDDTGIAVEGGVDVSDDAGGASPDERERVATVRSRSLAELLGEMNVPSDNFLADQLARSVAAEATGEGSWTAWESLVEDRFADLGVETVRVRDGSGLSRYNLLPARGVVALLEWAEESPWESAFFDSLPEPGTGTLSDRLDGVSVRAKTGTLTGARALSGRIERVDAPDVLFSVLHGGLTVDADEARDRQDALVTWLAGE